MLRDAAEVDTGLVRSLSHEWLRGRLRPDIGMSDEHRALNLLDEVSTIRWHLTVKHQPAHHTLQRLKDRVRLATSGRRHAAPGHPRDAGAVLDTRRARGRSTQYKPKSRSLGETGLLALVEPRGPYYNTNAQVRDLVARVIN